MLNLSLMLVTAALSVVMLLVLSSLSRSGAEGIRAWSQANWMAVIALPLFAARGLIHDLLSIELANTVYMCAITMMLVGFRRHLGLRVPARMLLYCSGTALATLVFFHYGVESFSLRVVDMSLYHGGVCLALGMSVYRSLPDAPQRYSYRYTCIAAFWLAFGHGVRAVVSLGHALDLHMGFQPETWNVIFFSLGTMTMPLLTLGAVMMANADIIARTSYAADHDFLTGAWSRRAFFELAERERARAQRAGTPLSVLVFDVDHFKRINDTLGHEIGDEVLVDIVRRTGQVVRQVDYCARLGGEEFAVLLPDSNIATSSVVAERLREALDRTTTVPATEQAAVYTVSIGIACLEQNETITALLRRADRALYVAKAAGRNKAIRALGTDEAEQADRAAPSAGRRLAANDQL